MPDSPFLLLILLLRLLPLPFSLHPHLFPPNGSLHCHFPSSLIFFSFLSLQTITTRPIHILAPPPQTGSFPTLPIHAHTQASSSSPDALHLHRKLHTKTCRHIHAEAFSHHKPPTHTRIHYRAYIFPSTKIKGTQETLNDL